MQKYDDDDSSYKLYFSIPGIAVAVAVVVVVGLLFLGVAFGMKRMIQGNCSKQPEEKQEMEWDNSALNVVVNPMSDEVRKIIINWTTNGRTNGQLGLQIYRIIDDMRKSNVQRVSVKFINTILDTFRYNHISV